MNTEVGHGLSCDIKGESNSILPAPLIPTLSYYTGSSIVDVWPSLLPFVEEAAKYGNEEFQAIDVFSQVYEKEMQAWVVSIGAQVRLVAITQVYNVPRKRICNIYAVAGIGLSWVLREWLGTCKEWLRQNEIDEIQATCRDRMVAKLLRMGFRKKANVVSYTWKERL